MPGVRFRRFQNTGSGRTGKMLGETAGLVFIQNAVELQFEIDPSVHKSYRNLRPAQWSGTEAVWVKEGHPLTAAWKVHSLCDMAAGEAL